MKKGILVKEEDVVSVNNLINEKFIRNKFSLGSWEFYKKGEEKFALLLIHLNEEFENYIMSSNKVVSIFDASNKEHVDKFLEEGSYKKSHD